MTIWVVASLVQVVVVGGEVGGRSVSLGCERRWRNSMDLLRSVLISRLTVLGQSLLRYLWVVTTNLAAASNRLSLRMLVCPLILFSYVGRPRLAL